MSAAQAQVQNSIASERRQMSEDALMWKDVRDELRDCEEKIALLLKYCGDNEAFDILASLEGLKGTAGKKQEENE